MTVITAAAHCPTTLMASAQTVGFIFSLLGIIIRGALSTIFITDHHVGFRIKPSSTGRDKVLGVLRARVSILTTDYRLLGRIHSSRASSILSSCIPPSQTAFLPGRLMGDNILTLQLLPSV
jgi:hypothetical protein